MVVLEIFQRGIHNIQWVVKFVGQGIGKPLKISGVLAQVVKHRRDTAGQTSQFVGGARPGADPVFKESPLGRGRLFGFSLKASDTIGQPRRENQDRKGQEEEDCEEQNGEALERVVLQGE